MINLLKKEAAWTYTTNGALTNATTFSDCLDLFSTVGALRGASEQEISKRFMRAWAEDPNTAIKIAFFARDVRGGLGERRVFRVILKTLAQLAPDTVLKHLEHIPEYGRYDDLMVLLGTSCETEMFAYIKKQLQKDLSGETVSLLAKWLPSVNASNPYTIYAGKKTARALGMKDSEYRRTLSVLRAKLEVLENSLRERDYTFDYSKQPSKAMLKYRRAFLRNDGERYQQFLEEVRSGERSMHTGTLYPYEVIAPFLTAKWERDVSKEERLALDTTWKSLPDYTGDGDALAVIDGSWSMYCAQTNPTPAAVALSLGLYFAQRNTGAFRGHFITFSQTPRLVEVKGNDLYEQMLYCESFQECANTDVQAVFELILNTAVKNGLKQEDLPRVLYLISDMEFDCCAENAEVTNFEAARQKFASYGYRLPQVVFWNVASRNLQQPVTKNEQGAVLVSGCTPRLFEMAMQGECSPYAFMMDVLDSPRYRGLSA